MFKSVIFDLGNVIVPFDFKRGYAKMAPLCSYPAEEIPKRIAATDLVHRFESGMIEPEAFVEELSALLELKVTYDSFCDIWSSIFLPEPNIPDQLLAGLRERYRLILLSNTNAIHYAMLRRAYPLLGHFHHYVLSHEVKAMKPSPVIYREAVAKAGCKPEECFFTDDVPAYVEGARKAGIDAVQFHSYPQLRDELRVRGILE